MRKLLALSHSLLLVSCMNPTTGIKEDIHQFKATFPSQIQVFKYQRQGQERTVGYAWSGNPEKRAIIFVHGSPGSWEGWSQFLLNSELQKDFHLIAVDRSGYGASSPGLSEPSLTIQADDILAVLGLNHSQKSAILIGHSYGGPVIARAATMDQMAKVAGLIFLASSVSPDLEATKWFQIPATWWPIRKIIPDNLRVCNEEILGLKEELAKMQPLLRNIKAKLIIIHGEQDQLVPVANLEFLQKNIEAKNILSAQRIPELNHFIPWKRPDLVVSAIHEMNHALK
jgi:pimeloyl-ACP methyl ester carboxylesterase